MSTKLWNIITVHVVLCIFTFMTNSHRKLPNFSGFTFFLLPLYVCACLASQRFSECVATLRLVHIKKLNSFRMKLLIWKSRNVCNVNSVANSAFPPCGTDSTWFEVGSPVAILSWCHLQQRNRVGHRHWADQQVLLICFHVIIGIMQ